MRLLLRSASGDNLVFHFSTISWLQLQQEAKWVNINFERRDLTSTQKGHPSTDDFGATFSLSLIKQDAAHFSFIFLTKKTYAVLLKNLNLNFCCQVLQVSPHRINGGLSDKGFSSVPSLPLPLLDMQAHKTAIFKSM